MFSEFHTTVKFLLITGGIASICTQLNHRTPTHVRRKLLSSKRSLRSAEETHLLQPTDCELKLLSSKRSAEKTHLLQPIDCEPEDRVSSDTMQPKKAVDFLNNWNRFLNDMDIPINLYVPLKVLASPNKDNSHHYIHIMWELKSECQQDNHGQSGGLKMLNEMKHELITKLKNPEIRELRDKLADQLEVINEEIRTIVTLPYITIYDWGVTEQTGTMGIKIIRMTEYEKHDKDKFHKFLKQKELKDVPKEVNWKEFHDNFIMKYLKEGTYDVFKCCGSDKSNNCIGFVNDALKYLGVSSMTRYIECFVSFVKFCCRRSQCTSCVARPEN